jgi:hypothetical protein
MKLSLTIAICGLTALVSARCAAQDWAEREPSAMSREEWQARIKADRERSQLVRRERRFFLPPPPTPEELAEEASRRVLEDDLRPGDIVSTNRGLFRYQGVPERQRTLEDFVRIR